MRILLAFTLLLTFFTLEVVTIPSTPSLQIEEINDFPLIVQSINNFAIRTNDIDNVLKVQFKDLKLGNVSTSYASILSSTVSISHYQTEKHVDNITPLKVSVTKDDLSIFIIFQLKVLHILGSKKYNCNVSTSLVQFGYMKEFDLETGKIKISNLKTSFSSKSFNAPQCKQPQSKKDTDRINQIINSTQGSSVYLALQKEFDKMLGYFNDNAKDEHLSQIYEKNPYIYQYYGNVNISIDVSTVSFQRVGETGLFNGLSGKIQGTSIPATSPSIVQDGYTAFYSKQFFQNLAEYAKNNLPNWKNIKLNGQTMRNAVFRYRLIDFQYSIPTILAKYPQKYLSDIEIQCNLEAFGQFTITQDEISQNIDWRCLGSLQVTAGKRETFLNFVVTLNHQLKLTASNDDLTVYVNKLSIKNLRFDIIDNHAITDLFTIAHYIDEGLFEFRSYTIGNHFKIKSPNQQIKVLNGRGILIG